MTEVEVLSGKRTIGGNFIKITDKDRILVFDQGMRFDIFGRYFSRSLQPAGVMDLRRLGVIPKEEWYKGATDVYITHLHLDHLGVLSNIPSGIRVHLPGLSIYSEMKRKWENSPTWLNLVPENYYLKVDDVAIVTEDQNRVRAIPVSHSAFPAVAYLYFGAKKTVLYTGDIRVNSFLAERELKAICKGPSLLEYLTNQRDIKIDLLLIEGTNFGSQRTPISPQAAVSVLEKLFEAYDLAIVTSHQLDIEFLVAVLNLAKKLGFKIYLSSEVAAKTLQTCNLEFDFKVLEEFSETPVFRTEPLSNTLEGKSMIISSYYEIIDICRKFDEDKLRNMRTVCILTEPEPVNEEMLEYETVSRWLSLFGIPAYRIRVSGHYYPFELGEILKAVKVKEVIPVHTEHPEMMLKMARNLRVKVSSPRNISR